MKRAAIAIAVAGLFATSAYADGSLQHRISITNSGGVSQGLLQHQSTSQHQGLALSPQGFSETFGSQNDSAFINTLPGGRANFTLEQTVNQFTEHTRFGTNTFLGIQQFNFNTLQGPGTVSTSSGLNVQSNSVSFGVFGF